MSKPSFFFTQRAGQVAGGMEYADHFWQEGTLVCVLTSDVPAGEVIQLAFAKAMPP